jgi:predicted  nucleic acid-binding Zn-ribbon protein
MKYVQCPRCGARFHTGVIYESLEACSRCGAPLSPGHRRLRDQVRNLVKRRGVRDGLDWEAITSSQYVRRHVAVLSPGLARTTSAK